MQKFPLTQTMVVLTHVFSLNMSYIRGKDMAEDIKHYYVSILVV